METTYNSKHLRNFEILEKRLTGYSLKFILKKYDISKSRFYQIRDDYAGYSTDKLRLLGAPQFLIDNIYKL